MTCEYCKKEGHGIESCPKLEQDADAVVEMVEIIEADETPSQVSVQGVPSVQAQEGT